MSKETRLTVTLDEENTKGLMFTAEMLEIDPVELLNDWILRDDMRAALKANSGYLTDVLISMIEFENEETAQRVAGKLKVFEQAQGFRNAIPLRVNAKVAC
jgi:c-di-GMP-related signal transduction protein